MNNKANLINFGIIVALLASVTVLSFGSKTDLTYIGALISSIATYALGSHVVLNPPAPRNVPKIPPSNDNNNDTNVPGAV